LTQSEAQISAVFFGQGRRGKLRSWNVDALVFTKLSPVDHAAYHIALCDLLDM